jgi:nucleotide-binding universal stress UspA family protein
MTPRKILFCTDFSENSLPARRVAVEYSQVFGAELSILHVINSSQLGYPSLEDGAPMDIRSALEAIQESADKALDLIASECRKFLESVTAHVRIGRPANEIVRFALESSVELIVMGTHGFTGIKHLILGSTAEHVVRTADCPVLTVRSTNL